MAKKSSSQRTKAFARAAVVRVLHLSPHSVILQKLYCQDFFGNLVHSWSPRKGEILVDRGHPE